MDNFTQIRGGQKMVNGSYQASSQDRSSGALPPQQQNLTLLTLN